MNKLLRLFYKETSFKNEPDKLLKVVRCSLLLSIIISVTEFVISIMHGSMPARFYSVLFLVLYISLMYFSYNVRSRRILLIILVIWFPWLFAQVTFYGWSSGVQQLLILILVIVVCCTYIPLWSKTLCCVVLLGIRLLLYFYSVYFSVPVIKEDSSSSFILQCTISLCVYVAVAGFCYIYASETQKEDGKLIQYNIQLENEAYTDALTGLYNRRRILEEFEKIYSENDPRGYSVAMCDIDLFKNVNDSYGHDIGDEVLKKVAEVFKSYSTEHIFSGRWGGEEFLMVFNRMNGDEAFDILTKVANDIRSLKFVIGARSFSITMTMGLAEYDFNSDAENIIKQADEKMYAGKNSGRNKIVF